MRAAFGGSVAAAISFLAMVSAVAAAERWAFVRAEDGPKLGYLVPGSNHFETLWFHCNPRTNQVTAHAGLGERRPSSGQATVTLRSGNNSAVLAGPVLSDGPNEASVLELKITAAHPVFALLSAGRPVTYLSPGGRTAFLATGLKSAVERFLQACR